MALSNPSAADLSRYSVGEVVDLSGVPDYYDAGASKWLKSGVFTASSNLPNTTKTNIANSADGSSSISLSSTLDEAYSGAFPFTLGEIARISSSSTTCYACSTNTTSQQVLTVKSTGIQIITTGLVTTAAGSSTGATALVVSNNSKFFHYGYTSSSVLSLYTSTDGVTWTSQAMTGLPTLSITSAYTKVYQTGSAAVRWPTGNATRQVNSGTYGTWGVVWCGARFLFFGSDGTNFVTATSTDGYTWTSNASSVLGSTTIGQNQSVAFYRNGNNCFLKIGNAQSQRYTSDGGVTWSSMSTSSNFDGIDVGSSTTRFYVNTTDPAKLLMTNDATAGNTGTISINSGQSFTTDITFTNLSSTYSSIAWKGSTMLYCNYASSISLKISTNNGTTFTNVLLPAGTLNSSGQVYADATRFYFFPANSGQVLTSTDGVTWTIVSLPTANNTGFSTYYGTGIVYFDTNKVVIADNQGSVALTTDGGVTWKIMAISTTGSAYLGNMPATPDGGGFACSGRGVTDTTTKVISGSSVANGGSFYKVNTITPTKTGAYAYVRVA